MAQDCLEGSVYVFSRRVFFFFLKKKNLDSFRSLFCRLRRLGPVPGLLRRVRKKEARVCAHTHTHKRERLAVTTPTCGSRSSVLRANTTAISWDLRCCTWCCTCCASRGVARTVCCRACHYLHVANFFFVQRLLPTSDFFPVLSLEVQLLISGQICP